MADRLCPRCGAAFDRTELDPWTRCEWCGSLLAAPAGPVRPLAAQPRLDARAARLRVARALERSHVSDLPGAPALVFYPLAVTGEARNPYLPLATLPPSLRDAWRPSGAEISSTGGAPRNVAHADSAVRVPMTVEPPADQPIVQYPVYRVPLGRQQRDSAAWCDAITGQVVLPVDTVPTSEEGGPALRTLVAGALAVGIVGGLALGLPWALLPVGAGAVAIWHLTQRT